MGGDFAAGVSVGGTDAAEHVCVEQMSSHSNELTVSPLCVVVDFVHALLPCISFSVEQQHGRNRAC